MRKLSAITMVALMAIALTCTLAHGFDPTTDPDLVGWWSFAEGEGTTVADLSPYGRNGTLEGGATWAEGRFGGGIELDGSTGYVEIPEFELTTDAITFVAWLNGWRGGNWAPLISSRTTDATELNFGDNDTLHYTWNDNNANTWSWTGGPVIPQDTWAMLAITIDATQAVAYVYTDAEGLTQGTNAIAHIEQTISTLQLGYNSTIANRYVQGVMDEAAVYARALTEEEILALTNGPKDPALASSPSPGNEDSDVLRDLVLAWKPGKSAQTHDVYLGTSWEDVDASDPATLLAEDLARDVNSLDVGRLEFGTTYFWRVDEVNGAPDNTVFKGDVWSFTVEPYSILVPGDTITVTASSFSNEFSRPVKTVDGSGLGADDAHATQADTMWFTASPDMDPWIQFELDGVKKLDTMKVWNSNGAAEMAIGWGVKDVVVEHSVDGETWSVLESATQFSRAPGTPWYKEYDTFDFDGASAKFVRFDIASNWGGLLMSYSLSEVQFNMIPTQARTPKPASGATDVLPDAVVTWRAGRDADHHVIYVDADANAVADGSAPSVTSSTNSLDLGSIDLVMGETYYWRVDEVNEAEATVVWEGPVWSLTTATSLTVDDFEGYGNSSPDRPFQTWLDGYGYSADEYFPQGYAGNGTGAGIGHDIWSLTSPHYDGDIMESTATIAGSGQSMPFYFTNSGGVASQTDRTFTPAQDWTVGGAQTLSIAFRGQSGNTGTLYAIINNAKVTYTQDPANIARAVWQAWNIDLASLGTNLQSVTKMHIGVDGNGADGMILIDDITLHAEAGELITPVEPDNGNLVLHYAFDEGAGSSIADSSGNGYSGTFESIAAWAPGVSGSAVSLDGVGSHISGPASAWSSVDTEFTLSFWTYGDNGLANNWAVFAGDDAGRIVSCHVPWGSEVIFDATPGWGDERVIVGAAEDELRGQWRHWCMVRTAGGDKQVYMDGVLYGSTTATEDPITGIDRFFIGAGNASDSPYWGLIDEFQLHNRALSAEEILWMAGVTTPIDKPF